MRGLGPHHRAWLYVPRGHYGFRHPRQVGRTGMIDVETFAKPITDATRYVRRHLPTSNSIELADLVQVGWERVTRYLSGADSASTALVFVTAKQGMLEG